MLVLAENVYQNRMRDERFYFRDGGFLTTFLMIVVDLQIKSGKSVCADFLNLIGNIFFMLSYLLFRFSSIL